MSIKDLSELRQNYGKGSLQVENLTADPLTQFLKWLDDALEAQVSEPYAMTLATADGHGRPHARTVLLRGADETGFYFYTNYDSQKGHDLTANPYAELLFFWPALEQQVRIHGQVYQISEQESSDYYHKRPRDSQIAAHISTPQSGVIESRELLEQRFAALSQQLQHISYIEKPRFWGGYCLKPTYYEFWQGRPNRLHDRLRYVRDDTSDTGWRIDRLMP
ncbi:pyridoxamine 5'-phosphate oxidase [Alkanindiges sp. WGS2144]|uniref:pyridoxamine 5'-phosphate oxidase n=1 Tax=Alkanindiges sp. WGS2144 TaxID=3366808 RepID=UPI00374FF856